MSKVNYNELLESVFSEGRSAKEIMSGNVVVVHADDPALEAAQLLVERRLSGLPVVADNMILVGIITEKDVLKLLIEVDTDKRVRDYMTTDVKSFDESKSVVDVCAHLFLHDIKRVPIVKDSKVVGVISRRDIIQEILRLRGRRMTPLADVKSIQQFVQLFIPRLGADAWLVRLMGTFTRRN